MPTAPGNNPACLLQFPSHIRLLLHGFNYMRPRCLQSYPCPSCTRQSSNYTNTPRMRPLLDFEQRPTHRVSDTGSVSLLCLREWINRIGFPVPSDVILSVHAKRCGVEATKMAGKRSRQLPSNEVDLPWPLLSKHPDAYRASIAVLSPGMRVLGSVTSPYCSSICTIAE